MPPNRGIATNWRTILHPRGLACIRSMINNTNERMQLSGLRMIRSLAREGETRDEIVAAIDIQALVDLLRHKSEAVTLTLETLTYSVLCDTHRAAIAEANGISLLSELLRIGTNAQRSMAEQLLRTFANVGGSQLADPPSQTFPASIALLKFATISAKDEAAKKLQLIIEYATDWRTFDSQDSALAVLSYLDSKHANARLVGIRLLNKLGEDPAVLQKLVDSKVGGIRVYTKLLFIDDDQPLQTEVLRLLPYMLGLLKRASNIQRVAIEEIISLATSSSLDLVLAAVNGITVCLENSSSRKTLIELGVMKHLVIVLRMPIQEDEAYSDKVLSLKLAAMKAIHATKAIDTEIASTDALFDILTADAHHSSSKIDALKVMKNLVENNQVAMDRKAMSTLAGFVNLGKSEAMDVIGIFCSSMNSKSSTLAVNAIAASGIISRLVNVESDESSGLQQRASLALGNLCQCQELSAATESMRIMARVMKEAPDKQEAVQRLLVLVKDRITRLVISQAGGLKRLVKIASTNTELKTHVARVLLAFALDEELLPAVSKAGGIEVMSSLLLSAEGSDSIEAAQALWGIAEDSNKEAAQKALVAFREIVKHLQNFNNAPAKTIYALGKVMDPFVTYSAHPGHRVLDGAVKPFVWFVEHGTDVEKTFAAQALKNMSTYEEAAAVIIKEDAVHPLVNLVKIGTKDQTVHALIALLRIALYASLDSVVEAGAVQEAVKMLRSTNDFLQQVALLILLEVAEHPGYSKSLPCFENAKDNLLWAFRNGPCDVRCLAWEVFCEFKYKCADEDLPRAKRRRYG